MTRVHYQRIARQPELVRQLHAHARATLPKGSHIVTLADMRALGGGNVEAGEAVLDRLLKMVPGAPGAIHPDAIRALGYGSVTAGRKVLRKFLDRAHAQYTETENAKLPANQESEPEADDAKAGYYYERVPLAKLVEQPDGNHGRPL